MCISLIQPFLPKYTYVQVPLSIVSSGPPLNQLAGHAPGTCHVYIKYLSNQSTYYLTGSIEHWQVVDVVCGTTGWHHNWTAFINTWYCHRPATETPWRRQNDSIATKYNSIRSATTAKETESTRRGKCPETARTFKNEEARMKKQDQRRCTLYKNTSPMTQRLLQVILPLIRHLFMWCHHHINQSTTAPRLLLLLIWMTMTFRLFANSIQSICT